MNIIHTIWQGGVAHECCRGDIEPLSNFVRGRNAIMGLCLTIWILVSRSCSFISPTWILGSSNKSPLLSVTQHMQHARLGICRQASPLASPGWSLPRAIAPRPFCLLANDAHCCRTKLQIQPHSLCKCIVDHSGSHEVGLQTGPSRKTLVT